MDSWVILELMGHRRLAGYLTEQEIGGQNFLRIEIPGKLPVTQFYSAQAVYAITPTTEEIAKTLAEKNRPTPVSPWELVAPPEHVPLLRVPFGEELDESEFEDPEIKI